MTARREQVASPATISERLAEHVVGLRLEDVPAAIVRKAKDHLVHHFGVACLGMGTEVARQGVDLAFELSGADGDCTIIGEARKADLLEAVFANSMLMGCCGMDDYHLPEGIHPGVVVLPAAWASGEIAKSSGRDLLTAVIVGYDVMANLCKPAWTWDADIPRRPNNIVGPMGAAAAASRLLGLSHSQTVHALGHAGQAAMGIAEGVEHLWTMHPLLARNGVMAAMLSRVGVPASPTIVEGRHGIYRSLFLEAVPDSLPASLVRLGEEYEIAKAETKQFAASALNFIPIELTQKVVADHGLTPTRVASVTIGLSEQRRQREEVWEQALTTDGADTMGRRGSLRFLVAGIISDGRAEAERSAEASDDELSALLGRVRIKWEDGRPIRYARIEVVTTDGQRHVVARDRYVTAPLDRDAWLAKTARTHLSGDQRARLVGLIGDLEHVTDVGEVMAAIAGPRVRGPARTMA